MKFRIHTEEIKISQSDMNKIKGLCENYNYRLFSIL